MPPVRWKSLCITLLFLYQGWVMTTAQEMQDAISMTSDGWRPIIGTGRQPPTYSENSETRISQYKSPSQKVEFDIVKSENTIAVSSTVSPQKFGETSTNTINHVNGGTVHSSFQGGKIPPHSKFPSYHTLPPPPPHRPSIQGRPGQGGFRRQPQKQETLLVKRKPARGQAVAHSNREEVYVHAPINIPYLKLGPSNVKPRETQGLGFIGKNRFTNKHHFTVNQPNSHVEVNRFPHPPTNDDVFEQFKSQTLVFPKLKNQQDEYTRNLVPPPALRHLAEKEKLKSGKIPAHFKDNVATVSEPVIEFHDLGLQGFVQPQPPVQENLVQVSEPYGQALEAFRQRYRPDEPAIDVQVTKEKVKEWQNTLPNRVNPKVPQYVDYDFHSLTNQGHFPKLQTYEVTEGKWSDNPDPYTFVYHQPQQPQPQQPQQPQQARQPSSSPGNSARPQLIAEPSVELHVPPFLPTPYRPLGPFPTSSTHSEASTVFSKVSEKMNRYKGQALADNPLFFDIKEVSTHYPILGEFCDFCNLHERG
ncbi:unnamed protein product [Phaedon cochleariae]|uniref:Cuticular protein n=1 Tax=Phaedon cochleariae TaxID=80249 RepID=A0A9N9SHJ4_PHACE|nr:unnamed protein product [Phaedon cochleariae]